VVVVCDSPGGGPFVVVNGYDSVWYAVGGRRWSVVLGDRGCGELVHSGTQTKIQN